MTSTQRYLANNRNVLVGASLEATSVAVIENAVLEKPLARSGSARVSVAGFYTGQEESQIEIEIVDTDVENPLISQPVFAGAGTGEIVDIAFAGTAQTFTVKLADLGQVLRAAGTDMESAALVARLPGANGNLIHLSVDQSGLTYTAQNFSLIEEIKLGADGVEGPQYDWDTKIMGADGKIPADAHRITFGDDTSTVYRQYKQYKDGKWLYHFEPPLKNDFPAGTRIKFVTGGRTVTVTDGTTTETYTGIVTLYDLLSSLQTGSGLISVNGVVANDRAPGGMAARDLSTRTDAHFLPSYGRGSASAVGFIDCFAAANASTELIEARCWAVSPKDNPNAGIGKELWQLKGSVSGDLGSIKTGVSYAHPDGKFGFKIPAKFPDGFGVERGKFSVTGITYASRLTGESTPPICVVSLALGPSAIDQQIILKYVKRPDGSCACADMPAPDLSLAFCLTGHDGDLNTMGYTAVSVTRLTAMYGWGATFVKDNSFYLVGLASPEFFIPDLRKALGEFETVLAKVEGNATAEANWDTALAEFQADVAAGLGSTGEMAVTTSSVTSLIQRLDANGLPLYIDGVTYQLTTNPFYDTGSLGPASNAVAYEPNNQIFRGDFVKNAGGMVSKADKSADADGYALTDQTPDGTVQWQPIGGAIVLDRHRSRLDWVLISGGVSPLGKTDAGSVDGGDGCWRDSGDPYYWEVTGGVKGAYAFAFNNTPYFSSQACGFPVEYRSTREFAFQLNIACADALREGDTVTLSIGDSGWPSTYQVGDVLYLPVIAAQDLYLAGGNDGDNVQTWHIDGSVDGPFPAYLNDLDLPTPYSANGLQFQINAGGIPFEAGDLYKFSVEGGHYRWRKDGGAWSLPSPVAGVDDALSDGLSAFFTTGAAPSFAAGDRYRFRALQPSALSNVVHPDTDSWRWSGDAATLTANLGAEKAIDSAALAFHTLPSGAVVTISGGADGLTWDWAESIPWRLGTMAMLWTARTATWLKIDIANADGGTIGWAWAGEALATELSAECQLRRDYAVERGAGLNPSAAFMGVTRSGSIEWTEAALSDADMTKLLDLLDHLKSDDDAPMILIPHRLRPEEAWPVRVVMDEVDYQEVWNNQPNDGSARRYSLKLPVKGVMA